MKIYLAGGFHSGWQDIVKQLAPQHSYYDPRFDSDQRYCFLLGHQDFAGVDWAEILFVNFERDNPSGVGLALEVGYAVAKGKRVIITSNRDRLHGFLISCAEAIFTDLKAAITYLGNQNADNS